MPPNECLVESYHLVIADLDGDGLVDLVLSACNRKMPAGKDTKKQPPSP